MTTDSGTARRWLVSAGGAAALGGLVIAVHQSSLRTLVSAHGLLHTAIAQRFSGALPLPRLPENPFFAGESTPYYWIFHYLAALLSGLSGIHPLQAFEVLVLIGIVILWTTAAGLGRRLYGGVFPGFAIAWLIVAGANALGAGYFLARVVLRGERIPPDTVHYLWGIAHPILGEVRYRDPYALYGPLLNFFFNITSRPIALALVLLTAFGLLRWLQDGTRRAWWATLAAAAAAAALSPLIGLAAGFALAGGTVLVGLLGSRRSRDESGAELRRMRSGALAVVLGALLPAPTYYHLFLRVGDPEVGGGGAPSVLLGVAASAAVLLLLGALGVWRSTGPTRRFLLAVSAAALALLGGSIVLKLPASNETNFFHAAVVFLAIPAAGALVPLLATVRRRIGLALLTVGLFLPTPLVVALAYYGRPPLPLSIEGNMLRRPPGTALARLYEWVEHSTPADAVFVLDPRPPILAAAGNVLEFPALTRRIIFTGHATSYMSNPYPDAPERLRIATRLVIGEGLDERDRAYLAGLGRPIFIVARHGDDPVVRAALVARHGSPGFEASPWIVFAYGASGR